MVAHSFRPSWGNALRCGCGLRKSHPVHVSLIEAAMIREHGEEWHAMEKDLGTEWEEDLGTKAERVNAAVIAAAKERMLCYPDDTLLAKLVELAERGAAS